MSLATTLMAVGLPAEQANRLGYEDRVPLDGNGTTQGSATELMSTQTNVALGTSVGDTAFRLPEEAEYFQEYFLLNTTAETALIFPPIGDTIDANALNASVGIDTDLARVFMRVEEGRWVSMPSGEGGGGIESIVAGTGINVDNTDPDNPVVSNDGVLSVSGGAGISVDITDPQNPVVINTGVVSVTAGSNVSITGTPENPIINASASGSGTVETVAVASANGFSGTSDGNPANPTLTLSTTVTGILQGNGTTISAAATTGSGNVVLASSPTLVTPEIGVAHGTQLTIDAATNITAYGLDIDKQFSGTLAGSVNGHLIRAAADVATITGANFLNMVTLEHRIGGAGFQGGRQTLQVALIQEGASDAGSSNRNYVAVTPYTQATVSDGGTGTAWSTAKGGFFAMNPTTIAHAAATNLLDVNAAEVNVSMRAGSSAYKKTLMSFVGMSDDAVSGSVVDAMIDFRNMTGAIGFNNALLFHDMGGNAQFPIKTTGTLLKATVNGATTIGAGVDISALTISGNAWASPSVTITGAGVVTAPSIGVDANFRDTIASSNPTTTFDSTDYVEYVRSSNNYNLYIGGTRQLNVNASAVDTPIGYAVAAQYVVRSRKTGWGAPTGTATRTTFATGSVTLPQLAERVKALIDDLTLHGLIGP